MNVYREPPIALLAPPSLWHWYIYEVATWRARADPKEQQPTFHDVIARRGERS